MQDEDPSRRTDQIIKELFDKNYDEVAEGITNEVPDGSNGSITNRLKLMLRLMRDMKIIYSSRDPEEIAKEIVAKVLNEASSEDTNDESMDGTYVSSSIKKDFLELRSEFAKLNAKIDALTQYHKTGRWPDN